MSQKSLAMVSVSTFIILLAISVNNVEAKTVVTILPGAATNTSSPGYSPSTITVVIGQNNTVIWPNADTAPHTVTSDSGAFDSGNLNANQTFTFTFATPGKYPYHCTYHSWMHGTVVVKSGTPIPEFPTGSVSLILLAASIAAIFAVRHFKHGAPATSTGLRY